MSLYTRRSVLAASAFAVALLAACATPQPIPQIAQAPSSALAIDVVIKPPMGIGSRDPAQVFFVRVDGPEGLLQQAFIRSNHVQGSRAYLLNARPGSYVAVAAMFNLPGLSSRPYTTYFPREVLEHTRVTVREGEAVFMGAYVLGTSVGLEGADEVQLHYKNVLAPGQATGVLAMGFGGAVHYRGALIERRADETARQAFVRQARDDLAASGWAGRFR